MRAAHVGHRTNSCRAGGSAQRTRHARFSQMNVRVELPASARFLPRILRGSRRFDAPRVPQLSVERRPCNDVCKDGRVRSQWCCGAGSPPRFAQRVLETHTVSTTVRHRFVTEARIANAPVGRAGYLRTNCTNRHTP